MSLEEKLESLAEILDCEVGELRPESELGSFAWDSMAMLSLIALMKTKFGKKVLGSEIRAFKTVQDVLNVME